MPHCLKRPDSLAMLLVNNKHCGLLLTYVICRGLHRLRMAENALVAVPTKTLKHQHGQVDNACVTLATNPPKNIV